MAVVTLYGKPGCHLCDDARSTVEAVRSERGFELREVDISLEAGLQREYGQRIPVVAIDGREVFQYVVDAGKLSRMLEES